MNAEPQLKQRYSREHWQEKIRNFKESQKSRQEFCEEHGLRYATFRHWLGVFERENEEQEEKRKLQKFQELNLNYVGGCGERKYSTEANYELVLGGARLYVPENFNEQTLSRLLMVMRRD